MSLSPLQNQRGVSAMRSKAVFVKILRIAVVSLGLLTLTFVALPPGDVQPWLPLDAVVAQGAAADLWIAKDCTPDLPIPAGGYAICTITVGNHGPSTALDVFVADNFTGSSTFLLDSVTTDVGICGPGSDDVNCSLGDLVPGAEATIKIVLTSTEPQLILDVAVVGSLLSNDPDVSNDVARDSVSFYGVADLQVSKECEPNAPVWAGKVAMCTIEVKNWGPSAAKSVSLDDLHLSDGAFEFGQVTTTAGSCSTPGGPQVGSATVHCDLGDIAPGSTVQVVVPVWATEGMDINDTARADSVTLDPNILNNSASDGVTVMAVADLELSKVASPNPVTAGDQIRYTMRVTNTGPSTAVNVVIAGVLPAGVTIDAVSGSSGSCNAGVPGDASLPTCCTFDTMNAGETAEMQIWATVDPQTSGILGNNARAHSETYDPDNSDDTATVAVTVLGEADLSVTKSDSPDPVVAGEPLTYDVTITNNGLSKAIDVMLTDQLPAQVEFLGYTLSNGSGTCQLLFGSTNTLECDLNDLDPQAFVTVFIETMVHSYVPAGFSICNTATVSAVTKDSTPGNDAIRVHGRPRQGRPGAEQGRQPGYRRSLEHLDLHPGRQKPRRVRRTERDDDGHAAAGSQEGDLRL